MANLAPTWRPKTLQNRGRNPKKSMLKNNTFSAWIFGPQNLPKTFRKPCPSDFKILLENALFFNIDFFRFRSRFWSLLGLQVGAKLAILASKIKDDAPWEPSEVKRLLKMASWRAPGSILEAPGVDFGAFRFRFWRVWTSFSKVLGIINGTTNAKKRQKPAKQQLNHKWYIFF